MDHDPGLIRLRITIPQDQEITKQRFYSVHRRFRYRVSIYSDVIILSQGQENTDHYALSPSTYTKKTVFEGILSVYHADLYLQPPPTIRKMIGH